MAKSLLDTLVDKLGEQLGIDPNSAADKIILFAQESKNLENALSQWIVGAAGTPDQPRIPLHALAAIFLFKTDNIIEQFQNSMGEDGWALTQLMVNSLRHQSKGNEDLAATSFEMAKDLASKIDKER